MLRRVIAVVITASLSLIAASCNTMEGVGKDLERSGEGLQNKAERERNY